MSGSVSLLPTHVIASMHSFIRKNHPTVKSIVFDPEAGYSTSIGQLRVTQAMSGKDKLKLDLMPMLSWNRGVLTRAGSGRPIKTTLKDEDGIWTKLEASVASFQYKFVFMATDMAQVERFELDYYAKVGINEVSEAIVRVPGLGEFPASVIWEQNLEDIVFNLEGNYYKALSGTATISGVFLTATPASEKDLNNLILEIDFSIKSCRGGITPDVYKITPEVP